MASIQAPSPQPQAIPLSETATATMSPQQTSLNTQPGQIKSPESKLSSHSKAPIQGPSLFSTDGGKQLARPAPSPREQPLVYSDFKQSVLDHCKMLRTKYPLICYMVFAPWDIRTFFDEYDFCHYGGEFLYTVLMMLMEENGKRVVDYCLNYAYMNKATYNHWYRANLPVEEMFAKQDLEMYGEAFMARAIKCLQDCCQRATAEKLGAVQNSLLLAGTNSDFTKPIPDKYYNTEGRSFYSSGGSFRGSQKNFSPEKQRINTTRGQDYAGSQQGGQNKTGTFKKKNSKARRGEEASYEASRSLPAIFSPPEQQNMIHIQTTPFGIPSFTGPMLPQPGMYPVPFPVNMPQGSLHALPALATQPTIFVPHDFPHPDQDRAPWTERDGNMTRERAGSVRGRGNFGRGSGRGSNSSRRSSFGPSGDSEDTKARRLSHDGENWRSFRKTASHSPILESQAEAQDSAKTSSENVDPRPTSHAQTSQTTSVTSVSSTEKSISSEAFANQIPPPLESVDALKARPLQAGTIRPRPSQQEDEVTFHHVPKHREDVVEVHVSSVPDIAEDDDVRALLSQYGTVRKVSLKRGSNTGAVFALVEFTDTAAVRRALCQDFVIFQGRKLNIKVSMRHIPHTSQRNVRYSPQDARSSIAPDMLSPIAPPPLASHAIAASELSSSPENPPQTEASVFKEIAAVEQPREIQNTTLCDVEESRAGTLVRGSAKRRQERLKERASPTRKPTLSTTLSSIGEDAEPADTAELSTATDSSAVVENIVTSKQEHRGSEQQVEKSQSLPSMLDASLDTAEVTTSASQKQGSEAIASSAVIAERVDVKNDVIEQIGYGRESAVADTTQNKLLPEIEAHAAPAAAQTSNKLSPKTEPQVAILTNTLVTGSLESPRKQAESTLESSISFKVQRSRKSKSKGPKLPSISQLFPTEETAQAEPTSTAASQAASKVEVSGPSTASKVLSHGDLLANSSSINTDKVTAEPVASTDVQQLAIDSCKASSDEGIAVVVTDMENAAKSLARIGSAIDGASTPYTNSPSIKTSPFGGRADVPNELRALDQAIEEAKTYNPFESHHAAGLKESLASCISQFNALKAKLADLAISTPGGSSKTMNKTKNKKIKKFQEDLGKLEEEVALNLKKYKFLQMPPMDKEEQEKKKEQDKREAKEMQEKQKADADKHTEETTENDSGRSVNGVYQHKHLPRVIHEASYKPTSSYVPSFERPLIQYIDDDEGARVDNTHSRMAEIAKYVNKMDTDKKLAEEREQRGHPFTPFTVLRLMNEDELLQNFPAKSSNPETKAQQAGDKSRVAGLGIFGNEELFPSLSKSPEVTSGTLSPSSEQGDSSTQGVPGKELRAALKKAQDDSTPRHLQIPPLNTPKVGSPPVTSPGPHSYARAASSAATPSIDSFLKNVNKMNSRAAADTKKSMSTTSTRAPSTVRGGQGDGANDADEWTAPKPWGPGGFKPEEAADSAGGNDGQSTTGKKRNKKGKARI